MAMRGSCRAGRSETTAQRDARRAAQRERNSRRRTRNTVASPGLEREDHREQRLARQRDYSRRRRASLQEQMEARSHTDEPGMGTECPTPSGLVPAEAAELGAISSAHRDLIEARLRDALGPAGLDEVTCAICDRLTRRKTSAHVSIHETSILLKMKTVLQFPRDPLPQILSDQYDCSDLHPLLSDMMLARTGIDGTRSEGVRLTLCKECYTDLRRTGDKPPKYAIANGFYVGQLPPHLTKTNWIETVMIQLATVVAQTRVMRGGYHRSIRSHCMVFDATPGPPATLLPNRVDKNGTYKVVLAGPMTDKQLDHIRKLHSVRGRLVSDVLQFLKEHNHFYRNVQVDTSAYSSTEVDETLYDRVSVREEDTSIARQVDEEQAAVRGTDDAHVSNEEDEDEVIERNVYLAPQETGPDITSVQRVIDTNPEDAIDNPRLRLEHSSRFANGQNVEALMHAQLFPFGRGHPGEQRRVQVSKRDCLRHYTFLSSRRFAQDANFMLTSFARLSMENMYTLTSVKCKRFPGLFEGYETITRDDLAVALMNNERQQRGQAARELPNPAAGRFLRSVEIGSASVWGSSAERRQCRQEAFACQTRHGQPSLFVTLTPNSDNSYAMAHYTGNLSVGSLFDSLEAEVLSPTQMNKQP